MSAFGRRIRDRCQVTAVRGMWHRSIIRRARTALGELATLELHRHGIERARRVGAVIDGAVWCQSFVDLHYAEAVRILDFAHAAAYLTTIAHAPGADAPCSMRTSMLN